MCRLICIIPVDRFRDQCIRLDTEKYIRDAFAQEGFPEALEKVKEAVQRMEQPEGVKPGREGVLAMAQP